MFLKYDSHVFTLCVKWVMFFNLFTRCYSSFEPHSVNLHAVIIAKILQEVNRIVLTVAN